MGKLLGLISGAGGIAGLLPWIIAALLGVAGAGGWLWQGHDLNAARADAAAKQAQIETLSREYGAALAANKTNQATIAAMQANDKANDQLIAAFQHQADEDAKASAEAGTQIRNLQNADAEVSTYLGGAIPTPLRRLLNHEPAGAGSGDANSNGNVASPKAK